MFFWVFTTQYRSYPYVPGNVLWEHVETMLEKHSLLAYTFFDGKWVLSKDARKYPIVLQAVLHVASCDLHLHGCIGARIGYGARSIEAIFGVDETIIVCWQRTKTELSWQQWYPGVRTSTVNLFGAGWEQVCFVQFVLVSFKEGQTLRRLNPNVPNLCQMEDPKLQVVALEQLNVVADQFWAEIADHIPQIESLYEDPNFKAKELAALVLFFR